MKILFICKHNIFRSRVAEEAMKRISNHDITSGGVIRYDGNMTKEQREVCKEFDLILPNQSKTLDLGNLRAQDLIIIVADDVPQAIFNHPEYNLKEIRRWEIKDIDSRYLEKKNIRNIVGEIIRRVEELNEELNLEE
jgi:protein-tyrosine-phosphatase